MFPTGSLHSNLFPCKCLYIFNVKINTKCQNLGGMQFRTSIQKTQTCPDARTVYIHTHTVSYPRLCFHSTAIKSRVSGSLWKPHSAQNPPLASTRRGLTAAIPNQILFRKLPHLIPGNLNSFALV